ncbi:hypothetical protein SUDANB106_04107 [Streptomyces sp. enrichment culture]
MVICILISALGAVLAGILVCSEGASMSRAVLAGGGAFVVSMPVCLGVYTAIRLP